MTPRRQTTNTGATPDAKAKLPSSRLPNWEEISSRKSCRDGACFTVGAHCRPPRRERTTRLRPRDQGGSLPRSHTSTSGLAMAAGNICPQKGQVDPCRGHARGFSARARRCSGMAFSCSGSKERGLVPLAPLLGLEPDARAASFNKLKNTITRAEIIPAP